MNLPLAPPIKPQLAKPQDELPEGEGWCYEPKLDGFRTIVFVDGDSHLLQSRNGRPMDRYFPELRFPPGRYVLDGELIIPDPPGTALGGAYSVHDSRGRRLFVKEKLGAFVGKWKYIRGTAQNPENTTTSGFREIEEEVGLKCRYLHSYAFQSILMPWPEARRPTSATT